MNETLGTSNANTALVCRSDGMNDAGSGFIHVSTLGELRDRRSMEKSAPFSFGNRKGS